MVLFVALHLMLAQAPAAPETGATGGPADTQQGEVLPPSPAPANPQEQRPVSAAAPRATAPVMTPTTPAISETPWYRRVYVSGFARVGIFYTFPWQNDELIGSNGGFRMADFRLNADFRPVDKFLASVSIELAAPWVNALDPLAGSRIIDLRDAFVQYEVCRGFIVRAGQFRPPYYAEMLLADGAVPFISRSVVANGLTPPDAYGPRLPLALERQVGLQISSRRLGSTLGVAYAVGIFNGNGINQLFNDNNGLAPVARVTFDYAEMISLGINANFNARSEGVRPNRLTTNMFGYGADVNFQRTMGVHTINLLVAFLGRNSSFSFAGLIPESAFGLMGQVRYLHDRTGLEAAARAAWLEPSTAQIQDQVTELAVMVGWRPFKLPFRILAQYTHREEEVGVGYPNDSLDLMLHATW